MFFKQVVFKRVVSADGNSVAQAYSEVTTSGDSQSKISQTVTINVSSGSSCSSSLASSSSASLAITVPETDI